MNLTTLSVTTTSNSIPSAATPLRCSWLWRQILWLQSKQDTPDFFKDLPAKLHLFHLNIAPLMQPKPINENLFQQQIKNITPPPFQSVVLKNNTQTFNHVSYYALYNNIAWCKSALDPTSTWRPIYFEGMSQGILPEVIQADGANLIIMARQEIYYKKVLEEHRDCVTQEYSFKDISDQNNWIPAWFTLPVLEYFQNPFADNHLMLPDGYIGFAISNRAEFCGKVEDGLGVEHYNPFSNSDLYVLMTEHIVIYDPYATICAEPKLSLPGTSMYTFEGLSITASASTIFVIGYKVIPKEKGVAKFLSGFSEINDHDLVGNNPAIKYDFKINAPNPESFILPTSGWIEHILPLGKITKQATIFQTGTGNNARELRIPGWNQKNEKGYFQKKITDMEWVFVPYLHGYSEDEALPVTLEDDNQIFKPNIQDFTQGKLTSAQLPSDSIISLSLLGFGENISSSTIQFKMDDINLELLLYKTLGVLNFIFPTLPPKYQLVLPPLDSLSEEQQRKVKAMFLNVTPVTLQKSKNLLTITPYFFTGHHFELSFSI